MHTCLAAQPNMHSIQPGRDERTGSITALQNNTQAFTCLQTINNVHKPLSQTVISDGWKISAGFLWLRLAGEQGVVYKTLKRPMKAEERWQACRWLQYTIPFYHVITIKSRTPREWSYTLKERERKKYETMERADLCDTFELLVWVGQTWAVMLTGSSVQTESPHTHTHIGFPCLLGTLHRRNGFHTVQTVFSIALQAYTNPTPKPTPYRKLSAFLYFQNTSFCMIYKLVSSWGKKPPEGQGFQIHFVPIT